MDNYLVLKNIHILLAIISVSIFSLRGILLIKHNDKYKHRLFRLIMPFIDSVLLILGFAMAYFIGASIIAMPWFISKMLLLVVYIVSGTLAINRLKNYNHKIVALIIAWFSVSGIFYLAISKKLFIE